jgi:N-acetylneuraminic acid mutarotase
MWRAPAFVVWLLPCVQLLAQAWTQRADIGYHEPNSPEAQWFGASFVIDDHAYVVAGVLGSGIGTHTTMRYDTSSGAWTPLASFPGSARTGARGFELDGKGYVFGGAPGPGNELWQYDPTTDAWAQVADLPGPGRTNAVVFVNAGVAHVCTGASSGLLADHWVYDALTNSWTERASLPGAAREHGVAFTVQGRSFVGTGHTGGNVMVNDLWEYDPTEDLWIQRTAPGSVPRSKAFAFVLGDHAYLGSGINDNSLWRYDPVLDAWSALAMMDDEAKASTTTFTIGNEAYVLLGSRLTWNSKLHSAWRFNGATLEWTKIRGMGGVPRTWSVGCVLDGKGHVFTGYADPAFSWDVLYDHWAYAPDQDHWLPLRYHALLGRTGATTFAAGGRVHVLNGGYPTFGEFDLATGDLEYDPILNSWQLQPLPSPLHRMEATSFALNGKGYLGLGGMFSQWGSIYLDDLWEFDPADNSWVQKTPLPGASRSSSRAFVLGGKAYVIGGYVEDLGASHEVWEYDPVLDSWQQRASLPPALVGPGLAVAIGDKGYVLGGNSLWEYDPVLDVWLPRTAPPVAFDDRSFCFSIGNKGYFGGGGLSDGGGLSQFSPGRKVFYEYSPADDEYTVGLASLPQPELKMWPNPVRDGIVNVHYPNMEGALVDVLDIAGRSVNYRSTSHSSDGLRLQLPDAAPGVYTVRVRTGDAMVTGRIVVEE